MRNVYVFTMVLAFFATAVVARQGTLSGSDDKAKSATLRKPSFPISKETTYITEPRDEAGYIDYEMGLNERLSKEATPENNAAVLLWRAFGPHPEGSTMHGSFFHWMRI